jgi:hypothetical protein
VARQLRCRVRRQPSTSFEHIAQSEAVRLFVERAASVLPGFALSERNAPAVVRLCLRLDGIPLALELAAARVTILPAEQLAERLDDALRLLTAGSRTAPARQQTLRATLDWSHRLLTDHDRQLFERLSVFGGGWTLEAAEAVCSGEGIEEAQVLELLAGLVDKSLVAVDRAGTPQSRDRRVAGHHRRHGPSARRQHPGQVGSALAFTDRRLGYGARRQRRVLIPRQRQNIHRTGHVTRPAGVYARPISFDRGTPMHLPTKQPPRPHVLLKFILRTNIGALHLIES